ncbi:MULTISPECIES: hypothetical protein [unclassified Chamaesiphon]|uniref:hypothetical protein n=1 Tax=unclassified Chamaesiphon TaxID=2620921 RepID=UPI00286C4EAA|nr:MULTISPECIES: hypothetical protein [unclassified Chamaesiphon]
MALITISDLNADLSASNSFLTELQATDSSQVFGGSNYGHGYDKKDKKDKKGKGHGYGGHGNDDKGKGHGYGYGGHGNDDCYCDD